MNWELQLAASMTVEDGDLLSGSKRARELTRLSRYGAALEVLWKPLVDASRQGNARRRAFLLIHMGHVYRHWMIDVAFRFFRDARKLSRESRFFRGEMVAECSLGQLYLDWREPERALPHLERGLALSGECSGLWWRRNVLAQVLGCLVSLGRTEQARTARLRLDRMDAELLEDLWADSEDREPGLAVVRGVRDGRDHEGGE